LVNCGAALQYLRLAGVSLVDEDDTMILTEDIINGDKELTTSLLWNMFVHLQVCALFCLFFFSFCNIIAFGFDYY
jgi:abnormal spindle-like microcephaly-associated protein